MRPFSASLIVLLFTSTPAPAEEPPLSEVLRDGDVAAKKRALAQFVPGPADEKQAPLIREALKDKDRGVRQTAAVALVWAGAQDEVVIGELINGMAEPWTPSYRTRPDDPIAARQGLVEIGAKAVPALVAALEDKKYPARASAVRALGAIGRPAKAALPAIGAAIRDRDLPGLHHIIEAKYHIDGDAAFAIKHLVPLLDTKEGLNCGGANRVIARMGADAKEALPALIAAMRKYKEHEICYDLIALTEHFRPRVVTALREALGDPELAASASRALRAIGEGGVPVDSAELGRNPAKYNWMAVRVEVVLGDYTPAERWEFGIGAKGAGPIDVRGTGTVDVKNGDRVAITGTFRHQPGTSGDRMLVEATMEKIPFDVTPEQLNKERVKYDGRLVRFEDEVADVRESMGKRLIELKHRGIEAEWAGKVAAGDRVRVTGVYRLPVVAFDPPRIDVGKGGSVEKLELKKP